MAGLIDYFKSIAEEAETTGNKLLYKDLDGSPVYENEVIADINSKLRDAVDDRKGLELQWRLNTAFLYGDQYARIHPRTETIKQKKPARPHMEREVFNQILPLIETRLANLKSVTYGMRVNPRTTEYDDLVKAETGTEILRFIQSTQNFQEKMDRASYIMELTGSAIWSCWWDNDAGDEYARETIIEIDEDGNEVESERVYYTGDLRFDYLSPYDVYPESNLKDDVKSQRYVIIKQAKSVEDIYDIYGRQFDGRPVETFQLSPNKVGGDLTGSNTMITPSTVTMDNACELITYFERRSRQFPNGRMIIICEDEMLYYGDLPYEEIPLIIMKCRSMPGQFFGRSTIEDLIPRQRAYNGCMNAIHEHCKRVNLGGFFVQEGTTKPNELEEKGAEPGGVITIKRSATRFPEPIQIAPLSSDLLTERDTLKRDMEYVAGTSQLMVNGATNNGINSGVAIQSLVDIDKTRLATTGESIRFAVQNMARMWLHIYKQYAKTKRIINILGTNDANSAIWWSSEDITSYDVSFTTENELVTSEKQQQENVMNAMSLNLFSDATGKTPENIKAMLLDSMLKSDYTKQMSITQADLQQARGEVTFFELKGIVPEISEFDNHTIHIEEHKRYIKQLKYQMLKKDKPELAKMFEEHIKMHMAAKEEEENKEIQRMIALQGGGVG